MRIFLSILVVLSVFFDPAYAIGTGKTADVLIKAAMTGVRTYASAAFRRPPIDPRIMGRRVLPQTGKRASTVPATVETPWAGFSRAAAKLPGYSCVLREGEALRTAGYLPKEVTLRHVGPRDGSQGLSFEIPASDAVKMYISLNRAGFPEVEATSWGTKLPAMGDFKGIRAFLREHGKSATYLVMRQSAARDFFQTPPLPGDRIAIVIGTTEDFNRRNVGLGTAALMAEIGHILAMAEAQQIPVTGYLSKAFDPSVHPIIVAKMLKDMQDAGMARIIPSDTDGVATPQKVIALMSFARDFRVDPSLLSFHAHRTKRPLGELSNTLAYLACGGTRVDVGFNDESVGGCPRSDQPMRANVSDMLLVKLMEDLGVNTGITSKGLWGANQRQQGIVKKLREGGTEARVVTTA